MAKSIHDLQISFESQPLITKEKITELRNAMLEIETEIKAVVEEARERQRRTLTDERKSWKTSDVELTSEDLDRIEYQLRSVKIVKSIEVRVKEKTVHLEDLSEIFSSLEVDQEPSAIHYALSYNIDRNEYRGPKVDVRIKSDRRLVELIAEPFDSDVSKRAFEKLKPIVNDLRPNRVRYFVEEYLKFFIYPMLFMLVWGTIAAGFKFTSYPNEFGKEIEALVSSGINDQNYKKGIELILKMQARVPQTQDQFELNRKPLVEGIFYIFTILVVLAGPRHPRFEVSTGTSSVYRWQLYYKVRTWVFISICGLFLAEIFGFFKLMFAN